jgi:hypothetical protein
MTDLNAFASRLQVPEKAWQPRVESNGQEALVISKPYSGEQKHDDLMRENGFPPEEFELDGPVTFSKRELVSGDEVVSYRFKVKKRHGEISLTNAFAVARTARAPKKEKIGDEDRALVVVLGDLQVGKTGSRGGTPELLERVYTRLDLLRAHIKTRKCGTAVLVDAGDIIEGVENVPSQMGTNDLSLVDMIDVAATIEMDFLKILAGTHKDVKVAGVSSNHAQLRKGKGLTNTPNDDWGLHILRQLKKATDLNQAAFGHVSFFEPEPYRESLNLDVLGVGLGLVHGHQAKPNNFESFLAGQVNGAGPLALSEIVIAGHYHHIKVQPVGRSLVSGRNKYLLQAPTLDAGSDWWANIAGGDTDAGMLVFEIVRGKGLDMQSLTVL